MRTFGTAKVQDRPFGGTIQGFRGAIATEHYLSAQAGMDMMKQGGNAFDAAAAATLVECVVNPHMVTVGGECPMLLCSASEGRVVSLNGNTQAPAAATLQAYRERGMETIPPEGVEASGPPATFSSIVEMLTHYGSLPLEAILEPAWSLAKDGFPAHEGLIHMPNFAIEANREKFLSRWTASGELYLTPEGSLPEVGHRMRNPAFSDILGTLMGEAKKAGSRKDGLQAAADAFYRGDIAGEIAAFVRNRDGFLSREDLSNFRTRIEEPVAIDFLNAKVFKCGPWSQGPVFLQILQLLKGFDLKQLGHNSTDYLHLWVEAAKLAFADREQHYADPQFHSVPIRELLSEEYSTARRSLIDWKRASGLHRPGDPLRGNALLPADEVFQEKAWGYGTVHVAAIDGSGNMAALTPSGGWISGNEVIPSLGFPLTSRLQTFYLNEKHPNVLAPGKRPRTTLSPSLAFLNGRPWMVFGTMGGDQQDQWTSQFLLNRLVFGMDLQEAIEAPKLTSDHIPGTFYPHDVFPRRVCAEGRIGGEVLEGLSDRGHEVKIAGDWMAGFICAVSRTEEGLLHAGSDPRGRKASVFPSCALAW
jgi:gamma-glutamyltranspeptidase / glutathione hydrolase